LNEISILMHLLSKKDGIYNRGTTREEIIKVLKIKNRNADVYFKKLLINLSNYIEPLGLKIKYNPLDSHWFLAFDQELAEFLATNPFEGKQRLAATLFCILTCCLKNFGSTSVKEIETLRKKKSIIEDLKELNRLGYIKISDDKTKINLTPLLGYHLDIEKLFLRTALAANEKKLIKKKDSKKKQS